jgi:methionyl-tRNA synthetase
LIKYSNDRNQETKSQLDQNTNNLLKRFISFVKNDTNNQKRNAIRSKIKNEQKYFFCDIRELLKTLQNGYYFTKVHNSI